MAFSWANFGKVAASAVLSGAANAVATQKDPDLRSMGTVAAVGALIGIVNLLVNAPQQSKPGEPAREPDRSAPRDIRGYGETGRLPGDPLLGPVLQQQGPVTANTQGPSSINKPAPGQNQGPVYRPSGEHREQR